MDLRYFDKMFTDEPIDSNRPTVNSRPREHSVYKDFTYVTESVRNNLMDNGMNDNKSGKDDNDNDA